MTDQDLTSPVVFLLASDLMLSSTVSGFASSAGLTYRSGGEQECLSLVSRSTSAILLLIDLGAPGLDVDSLAAGLPDPIKSRAVAYGPHVHEARLQAARDVGIGSVVSRGNFSATVGGLIREFSAAATE